MIAEFSGLHPHHQNRKRGLEILHVLKRKRVSIQHATGSMHNIKTNDTFPSVMEEVRRANPKSIRFRDILSNLEERSKKKQFLTAFETLRTDPAHDPYDPVTKPYCIWDLSLKPGGTLASSISIPQQYQHGYVFRESKDGAPDISATITPPGTISEPHMDQTGSGTLLIQVLGRKLFIVWPPTQKNLSWFSNKYGLHSGTIFEAALEALEMPYCLLLEQGDYSLLRPGHIHGVLSATPSAIAGVPVVHHDLRLEGELLMEWESKLRDHRKTGSPDEHWTVDRLGDGLLEDRALWARLDNISVTMHGTNMDEEYI